MGIIHLEIGRPVGADRVVPGHVVIAAGFFIALGVRRGGRGRGRRLEVTVEAAALELVEHGEAVGVVLLDPPVLPLLLVVLEIYPPFRTFIMSVALPLLLCVGGGGGGRFVGVGAGLDLVDGRGGLSGLQLRGVLRQEERRLLKFLLMVELVLSRRNEKLRQPPLPDGLILVLLRGCHGRRCGGASLGQGVRVGAAFSPARILRDRVVGHGAGDGEDVSPLADDRGALGRGVGGRRGIPLGHVEGRELRPLSLVGLGSLFPETHVL